MYLCYCKISVLCRCMHSYIVTIKTKNTLESHTCSQVKGEEWLKSYASSYLCSKNLQTPVKSFQKNCKHWLIEK